MPLRWREEPLTEAELLEQDRLDQLNMPPEVYGYTCPQCGQSPTGWCMTRNGNWAPTSHKKRLAAARKAQLQQQTA